MPGSRTEDLGISLEELHVALEERETTNEELATSKILAEEEGHRYQELFRLWDDERAKRNA